MCDTRVPLTIAFVSEDGTLFSIKDMQSESDEYHLSMKPARYALEFAQVKFHQEGLVVGSKLKSVECQVVK